MPNTSKTLEPVINPPVQQPAIEFHSNLVPRSFWLAGIKVDVQLNPTLAAQQNCAGLSVYAEQKIYLDPHVTPLQSVEQCFLHEMVHWIFFIMGEHELRNNERIVDLLSHFLYQALRTAEPMTAGGEKVLPFRPKG